MNFKPFPFNNLLAWYEKNGRHNLPWRQYFHLTKKDVSYRVWLSEILLQQTQANRVVAYFNTIIDKYPTIESLAGATFEEFFPYYQGLGYYSRARNLLKTANIIATKCNGEFPEDIAFLKTLPGVGPYTASAILAFAYDLPLLAIDTNIQKIFARYYIGNKKAVLETGLIERLEKQMKDEQISGRKINAALMDLASVSIKYDDISDEEYPLIGCKWRETRGTLEQEQIKKGEKFETKNANIIVILHENHKKYFSENKALYKPFILPNAGRENIRHFIQKYFLEKHGLTLSVRPVHDKFIKKSIPYTVCNAQIQAGIPLTNSFSKEELQNFWREFLG